MFVNAALSALVNVVLLAGIPFLIYFAFHKWRWKRSFAEIAQRAGLRLGAPRYISYSVALAVMAVAATILWPQPVEVATREGGPFRSFAGLGLSASAIALALLYGVVATGFSEELLFRGLIAGSLSRRLPIVWAIVAQALIFLAPHVAVLFIMPELWREVVLLVFGFALLAGWLRIKSGSIVGPWILHAVGNVAGCLSVAIRTAG